MKKWLYGFLIMVCSVMLLSFSASALEEEKVKVELPKFDITLNGIKYDGKDAKYPIVVYKDITYIPVEDMHSEYNYMSCLGFVCGENRSYSKYKKLFVRNLLLEKNIPESIVVPRTQESTDELYALVSENANIIINRFGKVREVVTKEYPILVIGGVDYLPMTYEIAHNCLGLGYEFSQERGLLLTRTNIPPRIVSVPSFDVTLNGVKYQNERAKYPFLIYNDITYMPMTKGMADFMGVKFTHTAATSHEFENLDVSNISERSTVPDFDYIIEGESISFAVGETYDGELYINGKGTRWHTFGMEYPPFSVGDVWYFPLTWQIAHDYLGWDYSFDISSGLSLDSSVER